MINLVLIVLSRDKRDKIEVIGARVHNLKSVDVTIPREALTVITGLSGSGKSSLAFDTIHAEGQRRYMETLSAYARQFMGKMERPDVDKITGLSPVIAIEQKTTNKNPRSTVGTVTEINDFLRLLYARASTAYSFETGEKMVKFTDDKIASMVREGFNGKKIAFLAPLIKGRKGHYRDFFESLMKKGYIYACIDGKIREMDPGMSLDRYKIHDIELVIDRMKLNYTGNEEGDAAVTERIIKSLRDTMQQGKGTAIVYDYETEEKRFFSRNLMCPTTGIAYDEPAPHTFSFNSPKGACANCNGLGTEAAIDIEKIVPDGTLSINEGAIEPIGKAKRSINFVLLGELAKRYEFSLDEPFDSLSDDIVHIIVNGLPEPLRIIASEVGMTGGGIHLIPWNGVVGIIEKEVESSDSSRKGSKWREQFITYRPCSVCDGMRLKREALHFKIGDKNIGEVCALSIEELAIWIKNIPSQLEHREQIIAHEILKEISERVSFLLAVGLGYLSLSRTSGTLSGGESQRIRLATQIGLKLTNVLYILDEPSIGLHQRDNHKLIDSLVSLRDIGNSVIVVEHDEDIMRRADYIIDIGPGAGSNGGEVVASGSYNDILSANTLTADYLSGRKDIEMPKQLREGNGRFLRIEGARGNNLKGVDVDFPLGKLIVVTGVSGSGKSTLINGTLKPILSREYYNSYEVPLEYKNITGIENVDKLVVVDQSPIGRTPRSNPATYTNVFNDIRKLYENTTDAKIRGYKAGRFSFNVKGGRCEECRGAGVKSIEMNFLPDVYVVCDHCNGKRYNRETLEVKYKGKSINDVLNMTTYDAYEFFKPIPTIAIKLKAIVDVGLGYLTLGQPSTTLSGGESQRIKLASELSKRDTGNTLFILDEPTTGLHFEDIRVLMLAIDKLVDRGNSVIVIEHNLDVIKCADHIIDIGKEGGRDGGQLIFSGSPQELVKCKDSYTGIYLKEKLANSI